jgi:ATP-dependent Zn protease
MVIAMAGRCAERLLLGEDYVTGSSAGYMKDASLIARQMVMRYGYSEKIGPVVRRGTTSAP